MQKDLHSNLNIWSMMTSVVVFRLNDEGTHVRWSALVIKSLETSGNIAVSCKISASVGVRILAGSAVRPVNSFTHSRTTLPASPCDGALSVWFVCAEGRAVVTTSSTDSTVVSCRSGRARLRRRGIREELTKGSKYRVEKRMTAGDTRHFFTSINSERYVKPTSNPMHAAIRDPGTCPSASFSRQ